MTKKALLAELTGHNATFKTESEAGRAIDAVFAGTAALLKRGEDVRITGFGSFAAKMRDGRIGRNPMTGAPINIPAKRVVGFKSKIAL